MQALLTEKRISSVQSSSFIEQEQSWVFECRLSCGFQFKEVLSHGKKGNPSSPFHYGSVREISEEGRNNGRKPKKTELWNLVGKQTASRMPVLTGGSQSKRVTMSSPARQ